MKIIDGQALTDTGQSITKLVKIAGTTFRYHAHGPSFYNGMGKFEVRKVNTPERITGGIDQAGKVHVGASVDIGGLFGSLNVKDAHLLTALGRMCEDSDFDAVREAVAAA